MNVPIGGQELRDMYGMESGWMDGWVFRYHSFFAALAPSEDRLDDPVERALHFLCAVLCRRRRQH